MHKRNLVTLLDVMLLRSTIQEAEIERLKRLPTIDRSNCKKPETYPGGAYYSAQAAIMLSDFAKTVAATTEQEAPGTPLAAQCMADDALGNLSFLRGLPVADERKVRDELRRLAKEAYEAGRGLGYKKGFERGIAEAGKRAADEADEAWNAGCIREQVREARRATTCEMAKGSSAAAAGWCRCSYCEGRDDALNELLDKLEGKSLKGGETTLGAPLDKVVDLAADSGGIQGCEMLPIYGTRDAKTWAEQYLKWVDGRGFSVLPGEEYETFRWFANAIGTGFDLGVKSEAKRNSLNGGDAS